MKKILFVCYGNICRSPSAEGIFKSLLVKQGIDHLFEIDSAGTHDFHIGKAPDNRAIEAAQSINVDLSALRCRQVKESDFTYYDLIWVMDKKNKENLLKICPKDMTHKIVEFISYLPDSELDYVPDPFHGGAKDFTEMMNLLLHLSKAAIKTLVN